MRSIKIEEGFVNFNIARNYGNKKRDILAMAIFADGLPKDIAPDVAKMMGRPITMTFTPKHQNGNRKPGHYSVEIKSEE